MALQPLLLHFQWTTVSSRGQHCSRNQIKLRMTTQVRPRVAAKWKLQVHERWNALTLYLSGWLDPLGQGGVDNHPGQKETPGQWPADVSGKLNSFGDVQYVISVGSRSEVRGPWAGGGWHVLVTTAGSRARMGGRTNNNPLYFILGFYLLFTAIQTPVRCVSWSQLTWSIPRLGSHRFC